MIYIWNIDGLKSDLAKKSISGGNTLIYLACILAVQTVSWFLIYSVDSAFNIWDKTETVGFALFLIMGAGYCYHSNGGRKGTDFIKRYVSLAWVFGVRYTAVVLIPLSLVLYTPISMFAELPDSTQWYDALFNAILRIPFYLVLAGHIRDVALNRLPSEDELSDVRYRYPEDFNGLRYPAVLRRYPATFIDGIFVLFLYIVLADIVQGSRDLNLITRILLGCSLLFLYEPVLTSRFCTIGQKIMGVRVRKADSEGKISILNACIRTAVKALLGAVSYFLIPVTRKGRGLHDFAAGSVVVKNQGNTRGASHPQDSGTG